MANGSNARSARVRVPKQGRSRVTRRRIEGAVIDLLVEHGVAGLRHRDIAKKAGVSLAATTYHYRSKLDLLSNSSDALLSSYTRALHAFAARHRAEANPDLIFPDFVGLLLHNLTGRDRDRTIAWCEIMIACARYPEMRGISQLWYEAFAEFWAKIAALAGKPRDREHLLSLIDHVVGILFLAIPLRLPPEEVALMRAQGLDKVLHRSPVASTGEPAGRVRSKRTTTTRGALLDAAIDLLVVEGVAGVTGRQVAKVAGVASMVPFYHFQSTAGLLSATRLRLYEIARDRYRGVMAHVDRNAITADQLVDFTATIFQREVTQFGDLNLASFSLEIEAVRRPELSAPVRHWALDQHRAWQGLLNRFSYAERAGDALFAMTMFTGKQIRLLSTEARTSDLANVRREFATALRAMLAGKSWI